MLAFIPVVPSTPSPRAEALGQRLAETIEQFRQQNPDLSGLDVRQAMQIAVSRSGGTSAPAPVLLALVAAVAVAGLALALAADKPRAGGESWTLMMLIGGIALALGVVVMLKRR
jgi:LPXTG-motif cell wall-anchored protein